MIYMIYRLVSGLGNVLLLFLLFGVVLVFIGVIAYCIENHTWLNLVWIIPTAFLMCWIFGEDLE